MNYKSVILTDKNRTNFALSNEFPNTFELTDAIEDAKNVKDLLVKLPRIKSYIKSFSLDRETDTYIRINCIAYMCNNHYYLLIYK